jgi:hypothetical protein
MAKIVSMKWLKEMESMILQEQPITQTISFRPGLQELIKLFVKFQVGFKLTNLGAGVTVITTIENECPCCKRPL